MAFIPTCKRDREVAGSHAAALEGVAAVGVAVVTFLGGAVAVAMFAAGAVGVAVLSSVDVVDGNEGRGGVCVGGDEKTAVAAVALDSVGGGSVAVPGVAEAVLAGRTGIAVGIGE